MIRQYHAPRHLGGDNPRRVGTIPVGTIVYIQDCRDLRDARRVNPWIVTAWHNRKYFPHSKNRPETVYLPGGHLATVKSLRDGRECLVADHILLAHDDAGLAVQL